MLNLKRSLWIIVLLIDKRTSILLLWLQLVLTHNTIPNIVVIDSSTINLLLPYLNLTIWSSRYYHIFIKLGKCIHMIIVSQHNIARVSHPMTLLNTTLLILNIVDVLLMLQKLLETPKFKMLILATCSEHQLKLLGLMIHNFQGLYWEYDIGVGVRNDLDAFVEFPDFHFFCGSCRKKHIIYWGYAVYLGGVGVDYGILLFVFIL